MRSSWTRSIAPFSTREVIGVAIAIAIVTALQTRGVFDWGPVRWTRVSALPRETLFLTGPVACAVGAWAARVNTTVIATPVPSRPWGGLVSRHLRVTVGATYVGFAAGLAPAFVAACVRATSGGVDVLVAVSGFAALTAFVTLGYLTGSKLGAPAGVAAGFVVGFVVGPGLMVLSDTVSAQNPRLSLFSVIPYWTFPISRGAHEVWQLALFRTMFFAVLSAAFIGITVRILQDPHRRRRDTQATFAAWLLLPVVTASCAVAAQPAVAVADNDPGVQCRQIESGSVCVYAEEAAILGDASETLDELVRRFGLGNLSGKFTSVTNHHAMSDTSRDLLFIPQVDYGREWMIETLNYDAARALSGSSACQRHLYDEYGPSYYNTAPLQAREGDVVGQLVAAEIASRAGTNATDTLMLPQDQGSSGWDKTNEATGRISRMSDLQLRQWLARNSDALASCLLRAAQLPE